jgi:hypothetical protein
MLILPGMSSKNTGAGCAQKGKRIVRYDSMNTMGKAAAVGPLTAAKKEEKGQRKTDNRQPSGGGAAQTMPINPSVGKSTRAEPLLCRATGNCA